MEKAIFKGIKSNEISIRSALKYKIWVATLVWIAIILFRLNNFVLNLELNVALLSATIYTLVCAVFYYTIYLYYIPNYWLQKKTAVFYGLTFFTFLFFSILLLIVEKRYFMGLYLPGMEGDTIFQRRVFGNNLFLFLTALFSMFMYRQAENKHLRNQKRELEALSFEAELKLLKSQINPHFLFNALNGIYALSLMQEERTPKLILKLSEMLRYILYDVGNGKVKLEKELVYIQHFIDFQQLKTEHEQKIKVQFVMENRTVLIEPMILQPLVENSFKHSKIEDSENGWVEIGVEAKTSEININIINSVPAISYSKDKVGGIGLENIKRRLNLLYPQHHSFKIEETESRFSVNVKLNLDGNET